MRRNLERLFQEEEGKEVVNSEFGVRSSETEYRRYPLQVFSSELRTQDSELEKMRRDARAVEGARLEIVCSDKIGTEGSNPSLSAMHLGKSEGVADYRKRGENPPAERDWFGDPEWGRRKERSE